MPWFAVDDGFDNHPKIRKAGNAAAGLFCRLGAYAARHSTEGHIPGPVARDYGTTAQLRKLTELGMLHPAGHRCSRCEQPETSGWIIHDYLAYNRSREEVEQAREAGAERQRKRRARLAAEAARSETATPTATPTGTPGETSPETSGETPVFAQNRRSGAHVTADDAEERARHATHPLPLPPTEVVHASTATGVPDELQPLRDALAQLPELAGTAWGIRKHSDWQRIRDAVRRVGVPAMVTHALNASRTRGAPAYVTAWIRGWESLADQQPPPEQGAFLLAIPGGAAPTSRLDQKIAAGLALADRLEAEERQAR